MGIVRRIEREVEVEETVTVTKTEPRIVVELTQEEAEHLQTIIANTKLDTLRVGCKWSDPQGEFLWNLHCALSKSRERGDF